MHNQSYNCTINVPVSVHDAFQAIPQIDKWWAQNFEGKAGVLNEVFKNRFGEDTFGVFKVAEIIPDKKIVWHCVDSYLPPLKDKTEWVNTKIVFEIAKAGDSTDIHFTHVGLSPNVECYQNCVKGWDFFIKVSLCKYLTNGQGFPEAKENHNRP